MTERLRAAAQAAYEFLSAGKPIPDVSYRVVTELAAAIHASVEAPTRTEKVPAFPAFSYFLENSTYEMQKDAIRAYARDYAKAFVRAQDEEYEALRKDAARFTWLLDNANIDFDPSEPYQLVIWEPGTGDDWKSIVRAAIDAARAAADQGGAS